MQLFFFWYSEYWHQRNGTGLSYWRMRDIWLLFQVTLNQSCEWDHPRKPNSSWAYPIWKTCPGAEITQQISKVCCFKPVHLTWLLIQQTLAVIATNLLFNVFQPDCSFPNLEITLVDWQPLKLHQNLAPCLDFSRFWVHVCWLTILSWVSTEL